MHGEQDHSRERESTSVRPTEEITSTTTEKKIDKKDKKDTVEPLVVEKEKTIKPVYWPLIRFPQRLQKPNQDAQLKKLLGILKQLHLNISLVEALEEMPNYVKFQNDILSKKHKLPEHETIALTNAIVVWLVARSRLN